MAKKDDKKEKKGFIAELKEFISRVTWTMQLSAKNFRKR